MNDSVSSSAVSNEELVSLFQKGDEQAFEKLVRLNMNKSVQIVYNAVGNYEEARDIAQDAFVKIHKALKKFELKSKFSTWFYRVLMNASKDYHRKKRWKKFITWKSEEEQDRYFEQVTDAGPSADQGVKDAELREAMKACIEKLPEKQRWIFTLRYLEDLSIREIEKVTGLSGGGVKSSLHFAAEKFKKNMEAYRSQGGN